MNKKECEDFIFKKLKKLIRIHVQPVGFEKYGCEEWDILEQSHNLSEFENVDEYFQELMQKADISADVKEKLSEQLMNIRKKLKIYSSQLAENAVRMKEDLEKVDDQRFFRLARYFEKKNKEDLFIESPSFWIC